MKSRRIQESSSEQGRDAPKIIATEGADFASTSAVSRWVCDKCHAVAFDDFEDASAHEKICKGPGLTKGSGVNIFKGGSGLDLSIDMSFNVESQTKRTPLTKRLTKKSPEKLKSKRLRERSSVGSGKKQLRKKPPRKRSGNQSPKSLDDSNQDQDDEAPMEEIYSKASEDCSFDTSADVNESSSGEDDSSSKDVASTPPRKLPPPNVNGSFVEFHLEPVRPHLICSLCDGYFRDPYTITECLHSFCKSCLFYAFAEGFRSCPKCEISLSPDPKKKVLPDRTLEEVVNTLFPDLKEKDEEDEKAFYEQRGIELQEQYREDTKSALSPGSLVCGSTFQSQMRSQIPVTQMSERKVSGAQVSSSSSLNICDSELIFFVCFPLLYTTA